MQQALIAQRMLFRPAYNRAASLGVKGFQAARSAFDSESFNEAAAQLRPAGHVDYQVTVPVAVSRPANMAKPRATTNPMVR